MVLSNGHNMCLVEIKNKIQKLTYLYAKPDMDMLPKKCLLDDYKNKVGYAKDVMGKIVTWGYMIKNSEK